MSHLLSKLLAKVFSYTTTIYVGDFPISHDVVKVPKISMRNMFYRTVRRYEDNGFSLVSQDDEQLRITSITISNKVKVLAVSGGMLLASVYLTGKYIMYQNKINPIGNRFISAYIMKLIQLSRQPLITSKVSRMRFVSSPTVKTKPQRDHTHPESASTRNSAVNQIDVVCMSMGVTPYYVQKSTNDVKHDRRGCRTFYWGKDLSVGYEAFAPLENEVIAMIDVDYYIDMPQMLANYPRMYIISTFQPSAVSCSTGEYSFTFDKDSNVKYSVSGGAVYEHQIWNYGSDMLLAVSPTFMSMGYRVTSYNVDRKQLDPHHQLIMLSPMKTFWSPIFDVSSYLGGYRLSRLSVSDGRYLRLQIQDKQGLSVSTGNIGSYAQATVPVVVDDSLASVARLGKNDISIAQVKTTMGSTDMASASVLTEYHRTQQPSTPAVVYPVDKAMSRYQFDPINYDPESKPAMIPFMSPIIDPAFVPDKCKNNDEQAVRGRITELHSNCVVTPLLTNMITEFIEQLIPEHLVRSGHPVSLDEVRERQPRPTQQALLDKADMSVDETDGSPVKSFMKAEPYDSIKDPRVISTVNPVLKQNYSSFVYAFSDEIMKRQDWYAFGKNPKQIAERVVDVCIEAAKVIKTDLSRFDGRVSKVLRLLEDAAMQRFFAEQYHDQLTELMLGHRDQRAFSKFCVEYFTLLTRLSGGADTADFNSMDNAFMAYVTIRTTKYNGDYPTPEQAFQRLGIYGGDDGLTADVEVEHYTEVCATVGQVLEAEAVARHEKGVVFLSRQYSPYVWEGDADSCCDVPRALQHLPLTTALPSRITPFDKLCQKTNNLALTDLNTPIIGPLCRAVVEGSFISIQSDQYSDSWWALFDSGVQWPNEDRGWMHDYVESVLPNFDYNVFHAHLQLVRKDASYALKFPLCVSHLGSTPKSHRLDVVVNGDIVPGNKDLVTVSPIIPPDCKCTDKLCTKNHPVVPVVNSSSSTAMSIDDYATVVKKMNELKVGSKKVSKPDSEKICTQFSQTGTCKFRKCKYRHVSSSKDEAK